MFKNNDNSNLKAEVDRLSKAKENIQMSVETLDYASKGVTNLIECQVINKAKSGVGYKSVPPPYRGIPSPPGIDLEHTRLPEFQLPELKYGVQPKSNVVDNESLKESESLNKTSLPKDKVCSCRKSDGPIIEDSTSDDKKLKKGYV